LQVSAVFNLSLGQLGWRPCYSQQLTLDDLHAGFPARVAVVQRSLLTVLAESGEHQVRIPPDLQSPSLGAAITVGDWVLIENETFRALRVLSRQSLIARVAAGTQARPQSIAANLDTLFVVTSCNDDFNPSRLERYLALAFEAQVMPVIALTKTDTCAEPEAFVAQAQEVAPSVPIVALNAVDSAASVAVLTPWLDEGQTIAFVGSSGVGKSTLINSLLGIQTQATGEIRENDSKGRHTTSARHMIRTPGGVWLIDTPGMRELKIGAAETGLARTFADIEALARQCRFRDCSHQHDSGCALQAAVADGRLDARRFSSYMKLSRETKRAAQTPWQRHQAERQFGRMARSAQKRRREDKGRE
jgi:ribosome biogenesis GTPase